MSVTTGAATDDVNSSRYNMMFRRLLVRAALVILALVCALLLLEVILRVGGEESTDGQFMYARLPLQPYALPITRFSQQVAEYQDNLEQVTLIYDALLGWKFRPNSTRQNGEFTINSAGMRSTREYDMQPPADTLRIALFGDSFTAGDDSTDEAAWSRLLEINLNLAGIRTEVLNFGVSAYGMDQAYLRWRYQGVDYAPDIVVFGLQAENLDRNVNVFRQLLHPLGPPFSKPRFVFIDDALHLVNSPTIPPEQLIKAFESFDSHPLAVHEAYYRSRDYVQQWWAGSKLASFVNEVISRQAEDEQVKYGPDSERGRLGWAIVDRFAADALAKGKSFIIVFLPHQEHLTRLYHGAPIPYQYLLDELSEAHHFVSLADHLDAEYRHGNHWGATLHYGPEINRLLADLVGAEILNCVQSAACPLPRFEDQSAIFTSETSVSR